MKRLYKAVLTVTIFTLADRILGFGFKVYLSRQLGAVNLGIYQVALSAFFLLLTFTTSGTPLIVGKLTAVFRKKNDVKSEHGTVTAALIVGLLFSSVLCIVIFLFRNQLSRIFAVGESYSLLFLFLPALLFSGIYAAFRGNMWGRQRYTAVSVIELCEQCVRIFVCVLLISLGLNNLKVSALSMSAACGFTAIACCAYYFLQKGKLASPKGMIKPLLKQSVPITMIRASNTLVASLVSIAVPFLLVRAGMSVSESLAVYGMGIGMALPLLYMPVTVVGSLAYVMLPSLSSAYAARDHAGVKEQIENAIRFSVVVASLFIPLFAALGEPIGVLIYDNADSGRFLALSAWLLIPIAAENIVSSMMNSLDLEKRSFVNYLIGAAVMFAVMFAFGKNFRIEVLSVTLGLSWTVSTILDIIAIKKRTGIKLTFVVPLLKCIALIVPAVFLTKWLYALTDGWFTVLRLFTAGSVGIVFFLALSLVFGIYRLPKNFKMRKTKKTGPAKTKPVASK